MDTALMDTVVASTTVALTDLVGALFTFLTGILPILLGLVAIGFAVYGVKRVIGSMRRIR